MLNITFGKRGNWGVGQTDRAVLGWSGKSREWQLLHKILNITSGKKTFDFGTCGTLHLTTGLVLYLGIYSTLYLEYHYIWKHVAEFYWKLHLATCWALHLAKDQHYVWERAKHYIWKRLTDFKFGIVLNTACGTRERFSLGNSLRSTFVSKVNITLITPWKHLLCHVVMFCTLCERREAWIWRKASATQSFRVSSFAY